jgi:hypothetical protein
VEFKVGDVVSLAPEEKFSSLREVVSISGIMNTDLYSTFGDSSMMTHFESEEEYQKFMEENTDGKIYFGSPLSNPVGIVVFTTSMMTDMTKIVTTVSISMDIGVGDFPIGTVNEKIFGEVVDKIKRELSAVMGRDVKVDINKTFTE